MSSSYGKPAPGSSVGQSAREVDKKSGKDGLTRLMVKQLDEINAISQKIELWKKYTKDYEDLKKLINTMQDKVRHPHRVPIAGTKLAFVDGHIVHTNELYVLLGYNYFALRSTKQASQIIDRRLVDLKTWIKQNEEAKNKTENWLGATREHKQDKEEFVEIIETM